MTLPRSVLTRLLSAFLGFTVLLALIAAPSLAMAAPKVIDYQKHLSKSFKKRARDSTRFIIIHSTESGLKSALTSLTRGGHTNYLVAVNGAIYRIVDKGYLAEHAGLSMWDGLTDISDHSIGIEIVGYHNEPFTDRQYDTLKWLIEVLQKQYDVPDWRVLEHFRVAYGEPNRYVRKRHRGRKKDPGIFNFDRGRAGLTDDDARNSVLYDPDVAEGRLIADPDIDIARLKTKDKQQYEQEVETLASNVITATNTAWRIARDDYESAATVYEFPDGKTLRGNEITDWSDLPAGTVVYLNSVEEKAPAPSKVKIPVIREGQTAIDIAGRAYRRADTYYIFPGGKVREGKKVRQWDNIPPGTFVLVGYEKPVQLKKSNRAKDAVREAAKQPRTVFLAAKGKVLTAGEVSDVGKFKSGTLMFVKKK